MKGKTMLLEFRKGWKGFTIFTLIIVLTTAGMAQVYPVLNETVGEAKGEFEGGEFVQMRIEEDVIHLSWKEVNGTQEYIVIEDNASHMATSWEVNRTKNNQTIIEQSEDKGDERYFGVIAVIDDEKKPVGIASTVERKDPLEELMDTPYFRMFTAGREDVRMDEIEGFMSVELYSWFILLVGVYLGYLSVKSVTDDFEEDRMDMIFSTPLSRIQYLAEKFLAFGIFTLILLFISGLALTLSVYSIGASAGLKFHPFLVSILISWPMFLVIISVSIFFAVLFERSGPAVGAMFAVILVQYALFMAGHMLEKLQFVLPYTISHYWDYNSVLLDGVVSPGDLFLLLVIAGVIFVISIWTFEKTDISI
ncbi:MAG: ABC transporter permease subunit [Candidatus Thermoplasmatota archaeon]